MKTTLIIKQQGDLHFNLLYFLISTSALIASTVMYHCCSSKMVLISKSSVATVSIDRDGVGWVLGVSHCGFLAQCQVHPVTHSLLAGRCYGGHQENKRRSSGHSAPK